MDVGKFLKLDKLDGIIGRLERRPMRLYEGQCLRMRDKTVECESCVEHCPVGAVDIDSGDVAVDFSACVDCGICVRVCPTGVFESRVSEDAFLVKVKQKIGEGKVVGFSCPKQADRSGSAKRPPEVEVPCLGRVTETMLVGAAVFGAEKIWLNLAGCAECENSPGVVLARDLVRGVDRLLEEWGCPVEFSLTAEPPEIDAAEIRVAEVAEEYDRRELLTKFGREFLASGLGMAEGRIDRLANVFDPPAPEAFTYRVPRRRELFLRLLQKMDEREATVIADGLSFYGLELDANKCNFCGNCASFCPTKALEMKRKDTTAELEFTLARCLGCDLCLGVCAPRALRVAPAVDLAALRSGRAASLSEQKYYKCRKCMQLFASAVERDVCDFCRLRDEKLGDDSWS